MGTYIEAVATSTRRGRLLGRGALHVSDGAATACLERAGRAAGDIDLLINTGLYKDANTAEPALAAIIQDDIDANPTPTPRGHGTFSFDILDGGCGVLTAARLMCSFLGPGVARRGLIVAGDVDPSPRTSQHFPFTPAGGAVLLAHGDDGAGFRAFDARTFPDDAGLFEAALRWKPNAGLLHRGRNVIEVSEAREFATRCTELATQVAGEFMARHLLSPDDIDLLITSQYPRMVAHELAGRLGIPETRVPVVRPELAYSHTAGPIAALEAAYESGAFARARRILFVTVGAGIAIGVALYVARAD